MSRGSSLGDEFAVRLPLSLAQLYRRASNANARPPPPGRARRGSPGDLGLLRANSGRAKARASDLEAHDNLIVAYHPDLETKLLTLSC